MGCGYSFDSTLCSHLKYLDILQIIIFGKFSARHTKTVSGLSFSKEFIEFLLHSLKALQTLVDRCLKDSLK